MLSELIDTHKNALALFEETCERLEVVSDEYAASRDSDRIRIKIGDLTSTVDDNGEWLRECVNEIMSRCEKQLPFIRDMSPEFAEQYYDFLADTRTALHIRIEEALAEEERRKTEFGLTAARKDWDDKGAAEIAALEAICLHRCANHDEERERLRYVLECPTTMGCSGSFGEFAAMILEAVR